MGHLSDILEHILMLYQNHEEDVALRLITEVWQNNPIHPDVLRVFELVTQGSSAPTQVPISPKTLVASDWQTEEPTTVANQPVVTVLSIMPIQPSESIDNVSQAPLPVENEIESFSEPIHIPFIQSYPTQPAQTPPTPLPIDVLPVPKQKAELPFVLESSQYDIVESKKPFSWKVFFAYIWLGLLFAVLIIAVTNPEALAASGVSALFIFILFFRFWDAGATLARSQQRNSPLQILKQTNSGQLVGKAQLTHLKWSPDDRFVAGGSSKGILIWELSNGEQSRRVEYPPREDAIAWQWSPDGRFIASARHRIIIWNLFNASSTFLDEHHGNVLCMSWMPKGQLIAIGTSDNWIYIWDVQTKKLHKKLSQIGRVRALEWSPDGQKMACIAMVSDNPRRYNNEHSWQFVDGKPHLIVWSMVNDTVIMQTEAESLGTWSPDSQKILFAPTTAHKLQIFDVDSCQIIHEIPRTIKNFACFAWSPDGSSIVFGDGKTGLTILNLTNNHKMRLLQDAENIPTVIAWSPNGRLIVCEILSDKLEGSPIYVCDAITGRTLHRMMGTSPKWSHNGDTLACIFSNQIMLWGVMKTKQE